MADVTFIIDSRTVELTIMEVFEDYEGPVLYSCRSATGQLFVSVWAASHPNGDVWLFLPVSEERLHAIRTGAIDLYSAFRYPEEPWLYHVDAASINEVPRGRIVNPDDLPDEMLPAPDERLDLEDERTPRWINSDPADYAASSARNVIDIALGHEDGPKFASTYLLGKVLIGVQDMVYSEVLPDDRRGPIPRAIREKYELQVRGTFAASFGVRLEVPPVTELFGQDDIDRVMESIAILLQSSRDRETLIDHLTRYRKTSTISKYRDLLGHLSSANTDFCFVWARPDRNMRKVVLSAQQIRRAVETLSNVEEDLTRMLTIPGKLVAINKQRNRFGFVSDDGISYQGVLSAEMAERDFVVTSSVIAEIEESIEVNEITGETVTWYTLVRIEDRPEQG